MGSDRRRRPAGHASRVFIAALLAGLPAVLVAGWLLWAGAHPLRTKVTLSLIVGGAWLIGAALVRERVLRPLQTIANLLAALREGDYSIRARGARAHPGTEGSGGGGPKVRERRAGRDRNAGGESCAEGVLQP